MIEEMYYREIRISLSDHFSDGFAEYKGEDNILTKTNRRKGATNLKNKANTDDGRRLNMKSDGDAEEATLNEKTRLKQLFKETGVKNNMTEKGHSTRQEIHDGPCDRSDASKLCFEDSLSEVKSGAFKQTGNTL